ncbi:hypothetical protein [Roseburia sp. 831b]|uniref:hypothetical protein n=1 Tax=Roseburia sp. 831b TaxID=1261635 RepID=UPI000951CCBA|nr:hypothetical protein [Roseburia sp. 831b]WVK73202.1 hypothetical protein BIV16_01395 [Roseburia sp. 831b]
MAMVQFKKEQIAQSEVDAAQKEDVTVLPDGVAIKKVDDDEDYDTSKNYYKDYDDTGLETYVISGVFSDEKTYIEEVREANICEYIYINADGNADIKVTEEQREEWLKNAKKNIEVILDRTEEESMCEFKFNQDYTVLESSADKEYSGRTYVEDLMNLIYNAEIEQIFSGAEDWSINIIIRNMRTGFEIINVNYPQEEISVKGSLWDE